MATKDTLENTAATGSTVIVDSVVEKVVGIAARSVPGVHDLGGGAARAIGTIREAIGQRDRGQGVKVAVGAESLAEDVTVVIGYPEQLQVVAEVLRRHVASSITELIGMVLAEINVTVSDVHIPEDDGDEQDEARVV